MMSENFPFTKQIHQKDCGSACLKMIAEYYGKNFNMGYLSNTSKVYRNGLSMFQIAKEATKMGFEVEALNIRIESIRDVNLPAILHWNKNHFVVLLEINEDSYHIADPSLGILRLPLSQFLSHWGTVNKDGIHEGVLSSVVSQ